MDKVERRLPTRWAGKVRITFDVMRSDGRPDDRVEAEMSHRWEPGDDSILFQFYGSTIYATLNDKNGLMYPLTVKTTSGGRP